MGGQKRVQKLRHHKEQIIKQNSTLREKMYKMVFLYARPSGIVYNLDNDKIVEIITNRKLLCNDMELMVGAEFDKYANFKVKIGLGLRLQLKLGLGLELRLQSGPVR